MNTLLTDYCLSHGLLHLDQVLVVRKLGQDTRQDVCHLLFGSRINLSSATVSAIAKWAGIVVLGKLHFQGGARHGQKWSAKGCACSLCESAGFNSRWYWSLL